MNAVASSSAAAAAGTLYATARSKNRRFLESREQKRLQQFPRSQKPDDFIAYFRGEEKTSYRRNRLNFFSQLVSR